VQNADQKTLKKRTSDHPYNMILLLLPITARMQFLVIKGVLRLDDGVEQLTSCLGEASLCLASRRVREGDVTGTIASPEQTLPKLGKLATFKTPAETLALILYAGLPR
jgi:hypothetical protein